jgi:hypothetical protein
MHGSRSISPLKNLVRQRCAEGFNSGVKGLRAKGLYMFRELLTHPQEVLRKWNLVHCVHVMSVGCTRIEVFHFSPGTVN